MKGIIPIPYKGLSLSLVSAIPYCRGDYPFDCKEAPQPRVGSVSTPNRLKVQYRIALDLSYLCTVNTKERESKKEPRRLKAIFHRSRLFFLRDPVGIQTQDLQNRNLTLYSAKLRDPAFEKRMQRYDY